MCFSPRSHKTWLPAWLQLL